MLSPSKGIYLANLEKLPKDLVDQLKDCPETALPVDPVVKIQRLKNPLLMVVIGLATRKVIEELKKSEKEIKHIVVIEPDITVFHGTIKRHYIGDFLEDPNIDFLIGLPLETLQSEMLRLMTAQSPSFGTRIISSLSPEYLVDPFTYTEVGGLPTDIPQKIAGIVEGATKQLTLSMGCASDGHFRWEQTIRNFHNLKTKRSVKGLFDKFAHVPAVVLGGGPSLEDFIQTAKAVGDIEDRALIIACDASLRRLLKEGIRPHIVTRCERKLTTIFDGVLREDTAGIIYAAYPWTPPEYFDLFQESMILYRNNGICGWTELDHGQVNGGVSSANAGLELAWMLGCNTVITSGIDLGFINGNSHVAGTEVEFNIEKSKPKWDEIEDNSGGKITSIPVWIRCLREYEASIHKYNLTRPMKVVNTSLKGAKIVGTELLPFDRAIEAYAPESGIKLNLAKSRVQSILDLSKIDMRDANYPLVVTCLEKIKQDCDKALFLKSFSIRDYLAGLSCPPTPEAQARLDAKIKTTIEFLEGASKHLNKLFLGLDDSMLLCQREEEKTMAQVKAQHTPKEFYANVESLKGALAKVYESPCLEIDGFKTKYYADKVFNEVLIDMCQLDVLGGENKVTSLKNTTPLAHERVKEYIKSYEVIYRGIKFYIDELIKNFKGYAK